MTPGVTALTALAFLEGAASGFLAGMIVGACLAYGYLRWLVPPAVKFWVRHRHRFSAGHRRHGGS